MERLLLFLSVMLFSVPALAQDRYWQALYANAQGQCGASLVNLAMQLDDAKKQISDLQKQIEDLKKK